jgi:hypothetical protein
MIVPLTAVLTVACDVLRFFILATGEKSEPAADLSKRPNEKRKQMVAILPINVFN